MGDSIYPGGPPFPSHRDNCPACAAPRRIPIATQPPHDCAAVDRDNLDFHRALTDAILRLQRGKSQLRQLINDPFDFPELRTDDLLAVLDRTSRPTAAQRIAQREREREQRNGGFIS